MHINSLANAYYSKSVNAKIEAVAAVSLFSFHTLDDIQVYSPAILDTRDCVTRVSHYTYSSRYTCDFWRSDDFKVMPAIWSHEGHS